MGTIHTAVNTIILKYNPQIQFIPLSNEIRFSDNQLRLQRALFWGGIVNSPNEAKCREELAKRVPFSKGCTSVFQLADFSRLQTLRHERGLLSFPAN